MTPPLKKHHLIGKILSDQLQPHLTHNIHPCQSAFIHERWIRKRGSGWLLFVDFSKANDSVNRASLLLILRRMGFNSLPIFCSICRQEDGDNPASLFTKCEHGKMALLLLFYHVCFAEALWKARCQAIWCVNQVSPNYICTLFWEAVSKSKKRAPPLEAQRSTTCGLCMTISLEKKIDLQ